MKIDSDQMTESPQTPGRTRTGLAKLRGSAPPAPPEPVTEVAADTDYDTETAAPTAPSAPAPPAFADPVAVDLTKPGPASTGSTPSGGARPVAARRLLVGVVALTVVLALLLWGAISWGGQAFRGSRTSTGAAAGTAAQGTPDDRLAVLRAGRQFAVSFFTYDYRKVDDYLHRVENASTGSFRADFVSKEKTLKTVVTQLKTVATGQVPDTGAGIVQLKGDNAVVLVAANFNASNAVTKNGQRRYRMKLALQRVKGGWLVSDFQQVV